MEKVEKRIQGNRDHSARMALRTFNALCPYLEGKNIIEFLKQ